jgi:hypothetical protein
MFIDIFEDDEDIPKPNDSKKTKEEPIASLIVKDTLDDGQHKQEEFTEESYFFYLSYYINIAKSDYWRHYGQVKGNKPKAWINCWTIDMAEKLAEFDIDTEVFTNHWLVSIGFKDNGISGINKLETWMPEIVELETYFSSITLPVTPIKLSPGTTIENCAIFIRNHLATVKANDGNNTFLPYLERLRAFRKLISEADDSQPIGL